MQRKRKTKTKKYFSRETKTNLLINLNLQPKKKNLLWKDKRDKKKDKLNQHYCSSKKLSSQMASSKSHNQRKVNKTMITM